jgi:hypothetical protein
MRYRGDFQPPTGADDAFTLQVCEHLIEETKREAANNMDPALAAQIGLN